MVDLPDEFESFVLLEVFDEEESLDLLLLEGDGGGRWRGKGEPGQIIKDQAQGSKNKDQDQRSMIKDQRPGCNCHCHCQKGLVWFITILTFTFLSQSTKTNPTKLNPLKKLRAVANHHWYGNTTKIQPSATIKTDDTYI